MRNATRTRPEHGFLRDHARDHAEWASLVRTLRKHADAARQPLDRIRALGRLGDALRLSPRHGPEAIRILRRACAMAVRASHPGLIAANRIRLGIALQYDGRHRDAVKQFESAIELIDERCVRRLKDYALQHLGKCYAEMSEWKAAKACFQQALRVRRRRNDHELIASTEAALQALQELESERP